MVHQYFSLPALKIATISTVLVDYLLNYVCYHYVSINKCYFQQRNCYAVLARVWEKEGPLRDKEKEMSSHVLLLQEPHYTSCPLLFLSRLWMPLWSDPMRELLVTVRFLSVYIFFIDRTATTLNYLCALWTRQSPQIWRLMVSLISIDWSPFCIQKYQISQAPLSSLSPIVIESE